MKIIVWALVFNVFLGICYCEEKGVEAEDNKKEEVLVLEVEADSNDQAKSKRQVEQGRAIGGHTQHIFGSAPGHYVLRTGPKEANSEPDSDYLSILRQIEEGGLQPAAAQARPTVQQYLVPRQQQAIYPQGQPFAAEQKLIQLPQAQGKRPQSIYSQNQLALQQAYQNTRIPLAFRPSQSVRPSPVQGIYTSQGFVSAPNGHSLHEARVQAALSVADDKPSGLGGQQLFQYSQRPQPTPLGESSFEKELAELVAANRASELKAKPQQPAPAQAYQYIQAAPQKTYAVPQPKPKQYAFIRPDAQGEKYVAPSVAAGRGKGPRLPQQYLIETTKPQQQQQQQLQQQQQQQQLKQVVLKQRPQYVQASTEEPRYFDFQAYQEKASPMKVVAAPQLQRAHVPLQYKHLVQKESNDAPAPAYLQYYQPVKPQQEDVSSANDVQLSAYSPRFATQKAAQPSAASLVDEQPSYDTRYQAPVKAEDQSNYVRYKAAKPQLTSQYSNDDDALIQSLLAQSSQKARQGNSGFSASKTASTETRPQVSSLAGASHSSIFVSKAIAPKKSNTHAVTIEPEQSRHEQENDEEEIQTVRLPPPKNNKVYTQEEFQALLAAGYSVTPIPVTEEEDSKPTFNLAPENYPGHSKYQPSYATAAPEVQTYQKQSSDSYATATPAPRTRKQNRRPVSRQHYRPQHEDTQAESESQVKLTYALPSLEAQETSSYGMRTHIKQRGLVANVESISEE